MGSITKDQRVLLVANYLRLDNMTWWERRLHSYLEGAGVRIARRWLRNHYRDISTLEGQEVSTTSFLNRLTNLTNAPGTRAVDLFLQLHGGPPAVAGGAGSLLFSNGSIRADVLGNNIKSMVNTERLRLLYNLSCYGNSHSPALLDAGFMASVGSVAINASAASEYAPFCRAWRSGIALASVVASADNPGVRNAQDRLFGSFVNKKEDADTELVFNSRKILQGDRDLTITTPPLATNQVTLMDTVRVHPRRNSSRRRPVINNRRMSEGCTVRAVNVVRVDDDNRIIDGPAREVTIGSLRRAGVAVDEDGVGTNSLRVKLVSWNGLLREDLRYRVVYTVDQAGGASCSL